ncbi:carboxypeptidase-like regulatory domain-containing protein [Prevotella aurantiaca]
MNKGKSTCKVLKAIRQKIADANGISYSPNECHYEGECKGTCPKCEAEVRYLEDELKRKGRNGFAIKVGGIAAGLCAMVVPAQLEAQNINKDSLKTSVPQVNALDTIAVKDLSEGAEDAIVVRGSVIFKEDKEPLIGASVIVLGTQKGLVTDLDGNFAAKVPQDASLEISYIGLKSKVVKAKDLLDRKNRIIVFESDEQALLGEVVLSGVVVTRNGDDVYNRTTPKYKSHKKKCKK